MYMRIQQKGQIMPVSLFGVGLIALTMLAVFNTSQLSSKKQRLNNATDAAAYSAAVFQARSLNSIAYTNRAMIANQVFIGQVISLVNYFSYWEKTTENLAQIPVVNLVAVPANAALNTATQTLGPVVNTSAQITMQVNGLLKFHQQLVARTSGAKIEDTVDRVLRENDTDIGITAQGSLWLTQSATRWHGYFEHKDSNDDLIAKGEMINDSRDSFTESRNYKTHLNRLWPRLRLEKLGITELSWEENGGDVSFRWDALDMLSSTSKDLGGIFGSGDTTNILPIGWSRRSISEDGSEWACPPDVSKCDEIHGERHDRTMDLATYDNNESLGGRLKIQSYYELKEDVGYDPRFPVTVSAAYKNNDIKTSDQLPGLGAPSSASNTGGDLRPSLFHLEPELLENEVEAVSRAEVFFRRPEDRVAGRHGAERNDDEFANVWNPYWGARLIDPANERNFVRIAKGAVGL